MHIYEIESFSSLKNIMIFLYFCSLVKRKWYRLRCFVKSFVLEENFDFIWNNVGITNLYSSCISTFVDASLVFSWLITENPVQGKSIWQNIPDFVTIPLKLSLIRWFRRKENGRTYSKYDMQWNKKGRSITLHSYRFFKYSYMN